jgi:glycosyltransferase involved in cell wall biosynthesis
MAGDALGISEPPADAFGVDSMRIAFIGQKGMPATFGGIEYHVDQLSRGLAAMGSDVSVYVRDWYTDRKLRKIDGVRLIHVPTIRTKHLDASVHSLLCSIHAVFSKHDIIHYHAVGPSFFSVIPKLFGRRVVSTVHRLDWQTEKWGPLAKLFLRAGAYISAKVPHKTIVVSEGLQQYFRDKYGEETLHIPHGIDVSQPRPVSIIREKHGLDGGDYLLFMGRLTPEKRVDWLIESFIETVDSASESRPIKLVVAGGSSSTDNYVRHLRGLSEDRPDILFTGYVSGEEKEELLSNAFVVVLPSYLEGFPIVLLEARSYGICCLASDISPHREAIRSGVNGLLFHADDRSDLTLKLGSLVSDPDMTERLGRTAQEDILRRPGWNEIVRRTLSAYEELLTR